MPHQRTGLSILRLAMSLLALAAVGVACQNDPLMDVTETDGRPVTVTQLAPSAWVAVEIAGQPSLATDGGRRRPSLVFRSEREVIGSGGCNDFSGPVSGESAAVAFGPFATTRKACDQDIMDQEQRYLEALARGGRLESGMNLLYLVGADGKVAVRFLAATEDTGFEDEPL